MRPGSTLVLVLVSSVPVCLVTGLSSVLCAVVAVVVAGALWTWWGRVAAGCRCTAMCTTGAGAGVDAAGVELGSSAS